MDISFESFFNYDDNYGFFEFDNMDSDFFDNDYLDNNLFDIEEKKEEINEKSLRCNETLDWFRFQQGLYL